MPRSPTIRLTPARWIALAVLVAAAALLVFPVPAGHERRLLHGAALAVFAMGLFATGVIPEFVTGLSFFAVANLAAVAAPAVVFAGWTSTALWLTFGGMIIGMAVVRTGLGARLAARLTALFGDSYGNQVAAMVVVGVSLAFVMPSTLGRVILLVPVVLSVADRLGLAEGRRGRSGLVVAMAWSTWVPSCAILPANVPNMVLAGVSETLYGIPTHYGDYLLLHFPVSGFLKAVAIYVLVRLLFPDHVDAPPREAPEAKPMSRDEKVLAGLLALTILAWATDFIHGISPAWIALASGTACLLPGINLVPPADFNGRFSTSSAIYVAAVLSVSAVIVDTGVGKAIGEGLMAALPLVPDAPARDFATLVGLGTVTGMAATAPGVAAILAPFAKTMAQAAHLPLKSVLMTMVIGYSTVLLPYQVPPLVVAMQLGNVPLGAAARVTLALALLTLVVLTPINFLWWRFLGYLP